MRYVTRFKHLIIFSLTILAILSISTILYFQFLSTALASENRSLLYISKDLSDYQNRLNGLSMMEVTIKGSGKLVVSVCVAGSNQNTPSRWINYYSAEAKEDYKSNSEKTMNIPLGEIGSDWTSIQKNIAEDIEPLVSPFLYIKRVSLRGTRFDLREISFSAPNKETFKIDFISGKTNPKLADFAWKSNSDSDCFHILSDQKNSFYYLQVIGQEKKSNTNSSSGTEKNQSSTGVTLSNLSNNYYNQLSYNPYSYGYPYSGMWSSPFFMPGPYSFSPYGLGGGWPFGVGYGFGGAPLLAMAAYGPPLSNTSVGLGLGTLGLSGLGLINSLLGLGGGLPNPLLGLNLGDSLYDKLFGLLFEGAQPVSEAIIIIPSSQLIQPPTAIPTTTTPSSIIITPILPTASTFIKSGGPGSSGGGTTSGGGSGTIGGGGFGI